MARRLTLIAGSGALVPPVAAAARSWGDALQIIDLTGRGIAPADQVLQLSLDQAPALLEAVREFGTTHVVLAGAVVITDVEREGIARAFGLMGRLAGSLGDIGLAGMIVVYCRANRIKLLGAHDVAPDLLAPDGPIAGPSIAVDDLMTARLALAAARAIGAIDLGQSVVFSGERAIAAEDAGGTDALLQRVAALRASGLTGNGASRLILAKAVKPRQPRFADLPAIGPATLVNAAAAGIDLIAVEAGRTLLLEREAITAEAQARHISVIGLRHG